MKRTPTVLAAATFAVATTALALAAPADAASGVVRMTLVETSTAFHAINAPAAAADGQAGDVITFQSTLSKGSRRMGSLEGHCLVIDAAGTIDDCDVTVRLAGKGSYRMSGPFGAAGGSLTITGGTGAYLGAGGVDRIVNRPDGSAVHHIKIVR